MLLSISIIFWGGCSGKNVNTHSSPSNVYDELDRIVQYYEEKYSDLLNSWKVKTDHHSNFSDESVTTMTDEQHQYDLDHKNTADNPLSDSPKLVINSTSYEDTELIAMLVFAMRADLESTPEDELQVNLLDMHISQIEEKASRINK